MRMIYKLLQGSDSVWEFVVKGSHAKHECETPQTRECLFLQNLKHVIRSKLVSAYSF